MGMMMSQKEEKRGQAMELLTAGKIDQKEAGKMLADSVSSQAYLATLPHLGLAGANQHEARTSLESAGSRNDQDNRDKDDRRTLSRLWADPRNRETGRTSRYTPIG
jgi:hypothetical protein